MANEQKPDSAAGVASEVQRIEPPRGDARTNEVINTTRLAFDTNAREAAEKAAAERDAMARKLAEIEHKRELLEGQIAKLTAGADEHSRQLELISEKYKLERQSRELDREEKRLRDEQVARDARELAARQRTELETLERKVADARIRARAALHNQLVQQGGPALAFGFFTGLMLASATPIGAVLPSLGIGAAAAAALPFALQAFGSRRSTSPSADHEVRMAALREELAMHEAALSLGATPWPPALVVGIGVLVAGSITYSVGKAVGIGHSPPAARQKSSSLSRRRRH